MDARQALVADRQPTQAVEPGEGALDDPAVLAQLLAGVDATPRNATADAASAQVGATARVVLGFVGVRLVRADPWSAAWPL